MYNRDRDIRIYQEARVGSEDVDRYKGNIRMDRSYVFDYKPLPYTIFHLLS